MQDRDLWARLEAFRFDAETGDRPFSAKLAEAEGWPAPVTQRVIVEYRRFLYLTQVADGAVTPSEAVDRAWHMHLSFTRSYWDDLCGTVLRRPLHHDPCAATTDAPRYAAQYAATRALYAAEFGAPPPADLWPASHEARGTPGRHQLVFGLGVGLGVVLAALAFIALAAEGARALGLGALMAAGAATVAAVAAAPGSPARRRGDAAHGVPVIAGGGAGKDSGFGGADGGGAGAGCGGGGA